VHFGLIVQWRRIPANKQGVKGGIVELANAGYLLPYFALILMTSLPSREKLYVTPWQSGVHLTAKDEELFSQTSARPRVLRRRCGRMSGVAVEQGSTRTASN